MLPSIAAVDSVEVLRDGGSLAATFVGSNGSRYGLHMALISDRGPAGELNRRGYGRPVVFERLEFRDQGSFGWRSINEVELSWSHASVFLHQLRPHVQDERDAHCLAMMLESVEGEGKLPAAMDEVLQPVKP
jgi:hypothetical protein